MAARNKMNAWVWATVVVGSAIATALVTKKRIRRRCLTKVFKECKDVPLLTDEFCDTQAEEICDI